MALTESFWPTPSQKLLLVTALGQGERAVAAWHELQPRFDLDVLEPGSFTLLPLAYRSLTDARLDEPLLPRLKGIYRSTWVKNTLLLERTGETANALAEAGVSTLFLSGLPLAARYYPDLGLRPTPSTAILVESADAAVAALQRARWFCRPDLAGAGGRPLYLGDRDGNLCVVMTSLGFDVVVRGDPPGALARMAAAAEEQELGGTPLRVPAVGDTLLALCVSGARTGPTAGVQWFADAALLIRHAHAEIDWARVVSLALEGGQALRLRRVLAYLTELPDVPVPADVAEQLSRAPVSRRERLVYAGGTRSVRWLGALPLLVAEHIAASSDRSPLRVFLSFPRHLCARWELDHPWQLPLAAGRRMVRTLTRRGRSA